MFQSQGTELVQVLTDGNVVFENIPEKKTASSGKDKSSTAGLPTFDTGKPIRMTADRGLVDLPGNVSEFHGNVRVREDQGQLDCQDLYLYSKGVVPQKVEKTVETRFSGFESLDDDPFAKSVSGVRQVPQVISLGEGRELDRVVALKDVVLVRRLPSGGEQRATGQKAEYFVSRRQVELSGDAPEYAQITDANPQNNGRSRKITVFLDRETVAFDGRVQMEFDAKSGKPGVDL
jgi:lipopolysaccharide export system protein LptA